MPLEGRPPADAADTGRVDDEAEVETDPVMDAYRKIAADPNYDRQLQLAYRAYSADAEPQPGDLVQWKPGMRDVQLPDYGVSAVFVRRLTEEEISARRASPYQSRMGPIDFDCYIGLIDGDRDFVLVPTSSRRLKVVRRRDPRPDE